MLLLPMMVPVGLVVYSALTHKTIKFLHPCIPAAAFSYPLMDDVLLEVHASDSLTTVQPSTATGRTYNLSRKEMQD